MLSPNWISSAKAHREAADWGNSVQVTRNSLPGQHDERAAEHRDHDRSDDPENGAVGPQRIEGQDEPADDRDRRDESAACRRVDLRERDKYERDADGHRAGQGERGGDRGKAVEADQADDREPVERVDAAAQSVGLKRGAGMTQSRRPGRSLHNVAPVAAFRRIPLTPALRDEPVKDARGRDT